MNNKLFIYTPSSKLDSAYKIAALDLAMKNLDLEVKGQRPLDRESVLDAESESERMLLAQSNGKLIAAYLEVPQLEEEIQRAVKQVEKELRGKRELSEEKQELESATKGSDTTQ